MNRNLVDRYAQALLKLADSKEILEVQLEGLEAISQALKEHPSLEKLLYHPFVKKNDKKSLLQKVTNKALNDPILNFLFFLIDLKRMHGLNEIVKEYRRLANEKLGIVEATVITAVPMDAKLEEEISKRLEKFYDKKVALKTKIDPHILGGMILKVKDQILDQSTRNRLVDLKEHLLNGVN